MSFEPYLAISASAGSGKTYALSVRYISLLYLGASPSKILTLTFTNKAASEMKSRIFDTIKNLENKNEIHDIAKQVGQSEEELITNKEKVLKKFLEEELNISTIDAFFSSILRKFALNAGFMPDFSIENSILDKGVLEKFLRLCIQNKKYNSLIKFALSEDKKISSIFEILDNFYQKEGEFDATIFPKATYKSPQRVLELSQELKELYTEAGASKTAIASFNNADIAQLMERAFIKYTDITESKNHKKYTSPHMQELFVALKEELTSYLQAREKYLLGEIGDLYTLYKAALRVLNKELGTLSFSDVSNVIYSLLQNEISREFLYFRLDGKIEHMLIDEYQDTNVLQYKILKPLMEEIVSGKGVKEFKSLFVGDVKQSIYRFRGGSKELFEHSVKEFRVQQRVLKTNYRSSKNVVSFVNETFEQKIKGYESQEVNSKEDGYVSVQKDDDLEKQVIQNVEFLLEKGVTCKDIAILTHQNKDAGYIKEILLESIPNIKVQTEASLKLIDVPLIQAILNLLKYAYFQDELFLQNFLVVAGRDFRDKIDISWVDLQLEPMQIIIMLVRKLQLFEDDMDIIKLIELASKYSDIESFLFECDNFSEEAKKEDNDGIKVLTIHKSKGLEFEHVLVLDRLGKSRGNSNTILYEYEDIKLQALFHRTKNRDLLDIAYKRAKEKELILEQEDKLNMYYVAFTRAESSLIVCAKEKSSEFNLLQLEEFNIGEVSVKQSEEKSKELTKMQEGFVSYGAQKQEKIDEEDKGENDIFAIEYGLALHYCLEMMRSFDSHSLEHAFKLVQNRYYHILGKSTLMSIKQRVQRLIEDKTFQEILKNPKRVLKEQPLIYKEQRKQIDLLIEKDDEVIIVDYKSSIRSNEKHLIQVSTYKQALENIYDLPIRAYLCYLKEDSTEFLSL